MLVPGRRTAQDAPPCPPSPHNALTASRDFHRNVTWSVYGTFQAQEVGVPLTFAKRLIVSQSRTPPGGGRRLWIGLGFNSGIPKVFHRVTKQKAKNEYTDKGHDGQSYA